MRPQESFKRGFRYVDQGEAHLAILSSRRYGDLRATVNEKPGLKSGGCRRHAVVGIRPLIESTHYSRAGNSSCGKQLAYFDAALVSCLFVTVERALGGGVNDALKLMSSGSWGGDEVTEMGGAEID